MKQDLIKQLMNLFLVALRPNGGLLADTPLRQTYLAHKQYWKRVRKLEDNIPKLRFGIITLHPAKQEYLPYDYDGVVDR